MDLIVHAAVVADVAFAAANIAYTAIVANVNTACTAAVTVEHTAVPTAAAYIESVNIAAVESVPALV